MATYLISYDLKGQRDYKGLYDILRHWKATRILESLWLADRDLDAEVMMEVLDTVLDEDDKAVVIQLLPVADWSTYGLSDAVADLIGDRLTPR